MATEEEEEEEEEARQGKAHTFRLRQLLQFIASFWSALLFLTGRRSMGLGTVAMSLVVCCAMAIVVMSSTTSPIQIPQKHHSGRLSEVGELRRLWPKPRSLEDRGINLRKERCTQTHTHTHAPQAE